MKTTIIFNILVLVVLNCDLPQSMDNNQVIDSMQNCLMQMESPDCNNFDDHYTKRLESQFEENIVSTAVDTISRFIEEKDEENQKEKLKKLLDQKTETEDLIKILDTEFINEMKSLRDKSSIQKTSSSDYVYEVFRFRTLMKKIDFKRSIGMQFQRFFDNNCYQALIFALELKDLYNIEINEEKQKDQIIQEQPKANNLVDIAESTVKPKDIDETETDLPKQSKLELSQNKPINQTEEIKPISKVDPKHSQLLKDISESIEKFTQMKTNDLTNKKSNWSNLHEEDSSDEEMFNSHSVNLNQAFQLINAY